MQRLIKFLIFLLWIPILSASDTTNYQISLIEESIKIDGILDDDVWNNAKPIGKYWQYFPNDSIYAKDQTDLKIVYDEDNLYIAAIMYHQGKDYVVPTLKRDYRAGGNDNITFLFDTFGDGQNCFFFGLNPKGVQREGLISGGGTGLGGFSTSWDNKWFSKVVINEDNWTVEIKIPFSTLRFNKGTQEWRFNSYRFDLKENEQSTFVNIPRAQWIFHLGYMDKLTFQEPLNKTPKGIVAIPYVIAGQSNDLEADVINKKFNIGGDAKIPLTSGLNLDITANPDFSQVEVDRQVTNLDRFEIFFPERRQFFLENEDLFSGYGFPNMNPFFSRRIGIAKDTATDLTIQNTIYGGARVSGKINEKLRVGFLNMQTAADRSNGQPSFNFGVATVQQKIGQKSNLAFVFVNKQSIGNNENSLIDNFNRVAGVDYNLISKNNVWGGKFFLHRSFSEQSLKNPWSHGVRVTRNVDKLKIDYRHEYVGSGYDAQTGFVRRSNYFSLNPNIEINFFTKSGKINRHILGNNITSFWRPDFGLTDNIVRFYYSIRMKDNSRLSLNTNFHYVYLTDSFDPTGTDSKELQGETKYNYKYITLRYRSNNAKLFSYNTDLFIGEYFNGRRIGLNGRFNYRIEPYVKFGLNYAINSFDMPYLDSNPKTLLLGPSLELSLSKSVFISTFLQYNSQSENTNLNARLQWRFAPVSDFFLVFGSNYYTRNNPEDRFTIEQNNRSIVAKVNYWLN